MKQKFYFSLIKNRFLLFSIIVLLAISNSTNLLGQVVIKERIEIDPPKKVLGITGTTSTSTHTIKFKINWDKPIREGLLSMISPSSMATGTGWADGGSLSLTVNNIVTPVKMVFLYKVNLMVYELSFVSYEMYIDGVFVKSGGSTISGGYSIPYRTVDYTLLNPEIEMLGPFGSNSNFIINTASETPTTIVKARLKYYFKGNVDYNFKLETVWTKTNVDPNETVPVNLEGNISAPYGSIAEWTIPWDERFKGGYSNSTKLTVTAVADGEAYTKELLNPYKILGDEELFNYKIYTSPMEQTTLFGSYPIDLRAYAFKGAGVTGLPFEYIPDDVYFHLVVTEGKEHGVIGYKSIYNTVTDTGTALYDLEQYKGNGNVYFDYIPHKEVLSKERVTIRVSTTDPTIKPVDLEITLMPSPFLAYTDPNTIKPRDTTAIFLKFINEAGDTIDFAEDQEFYLELEEGWQYGDLYSSIEDYTSYYMWYTPPPFFFIANNDTDEDEGDDTVLVYAETYIDFDDDGNPLPSITETNNKITTKRNRLSRNDLAILRKQYKEEMLKIRGNGEGTVVYEKGSGKIGGKPNKLSKNDMALLRKQFREERKKEMLQNKGKGEVSVVYEEDNIKITQLAYGSIPNETLSSTTVYTYFEIVISKKDIFYVKADFETETFSSGDTVNVIVKKVDEDGNEYDFDSLTTFEVRLDEGCSAGYILDDEDQPQNYIESIQAPIRFVVNYNLTEADTLIKLRVGVPDGVDTLYKPYSEFPLLQQLSTNANTKLKMQDRTIVADYFCSIEEFKNSGFGVSIGRIKPIEIMLGETKYFGLQHSEKLEIIIVEIPTTYGNKPEWDLLALPYGWKWSKKDVWGSSPIKVLGTKSGVYWEKRWFDKTDNSNKPLDDGMIRLIGRYWEEGKEENFKVKLKALWGNLFVETMIKVVKPAKLGGSHDRAKDVFNKEYNVDDLCIKIGGEIGVPPQMIKGQIFTESAKKTFTFADGKSEGGFAPSYRYEPYTTQFKLDEIIPKTNPFIVTKSGMGKPSVPTTKEHQHLIHGKYSHYFTDVKSVWDVVVEKSRIVNINNNDDTYGLQYKGTPPDELKKGQISTYNIYSKNIDNPYQDYLIGKKDKNGNRAGGYEKEIRVKYKLGPNVILSVEQQTEANNLARDALLKYLKSEWNGGLENIKAQTRIAASYGLLQMMYTTVYDEHKYRKMPEKLNEVSIAMEYSVKHLKKLFKNNNGFSLDDKNANWESKHSGKTTTPKFPKPSAGYEEALKVMIWMWNSLLTADKINAIYHTNVLTNSEQFLPRRK